MQWLSPDAINKGSLVQLIGRFWCTMAWGGAGVWGWGLHYEFQYIMVNGHMGTPSPLRQTDTPVKTLPPATSLAGGKKLDTDHFFNFMSEIPYMRCYTVDLVYHITSNGVFLLRTALIWALGAYSIFFISEAAVFECGRFSAGERFFEVGCVRQEVARDVDSFKNSVQAFLQGTIGEKM